MLENRDTFDDNKDVGFLYHLQRSGVATRMTLGHVSSRTEPLVDVPDQILGAYGDMLAKRGKPPIWINSWNALSRTVKTIDIML